MVGNGFLDRVRPGDFIIAARVDGVDVPCPVTFADDQVIRARVITIQLDLEFDAQTGFGDCSEGDYSCRAKPIPYLPDDVCEGLISIDRKYRLLGAPEGTKLLEHELRALQFFFAD